MAFLSVADPAGRRRSTPEVPLEASSEVGLDTRAPTPMHALPEHPPPEALTFDAVYETCVDLVWRSLKSLGVRDHRLEDAVQDVFVVVHRRLGDFEARSSVRTWVYGIAVRVARDVRRREQRKGGLSPLDPDAADPGPGPEEAAERSRALDELAAALESLDADKREAFVLADVEELTAPQIAEALGINLNTVYSRIRAARKELEVALSQREERRR